MKILGVLIDCNLDWHLHLKRASEIRHHSLSLLYPLRSVFSYDSRKLLATALTLSHLNYNSCVWYNCSSQNRKSIDKYVMWLDMSPVKESMIVCHLKLIIY
jgi:hypothetical protein